MKVRFIFHVISTFSWLKVYSLFIYSILLKIYPGYCGSAILTRLHPVCWSNNVIVPSLHGSLPIYPFYSHIWLKSYSPYASSFRKVDYSPYASSSIKGGPIYFELHSSAQYIVYDLWTSKSFYDSNFLHGLN